MLITAVIHRRGGVGDTNGADADKHSEVRMLQNSEKSFTSKYSSCSMPRMIVGDLMVLSLSYDNMLLNHRATRRI
jgi:hypothetical protein